MVLKFSPPEPNRAYNWAQNLPLVVDEKISHSPLRVFDGILCNEFRKQSYELYALNANKN
jgi:hypothetical protein